MSIWDYMKKAAPTPAPRTIERQDGRLVIQWDDGASTASTARDLRAECPCAACIDEFTRVRILDPSKIPANIAVDEVERVGNYALRLVFNDGHDTGIYDWKLLRFVGEHPVGG